MINIELTEMQLRVMFSSDMNFQVIPIRCDIITKRTFIFWFFIALHFLMPRQVTLLTVSFVTIGTFIFSEMHRNSSSRYTASHTT